MTQAEAGQDGGAEHAREVGLAMSKSSKHEVIERGIRFPQARSDGFEYGIHWNGRRGAGAFLEIMAWGSDPFYPTYRITLGDLLKGLGITAADCALALEATEGR